MSVKEQRLKLINKVSIKKGWSFGKEKSVAGEVVFNTAMAGYEIPSSTPPTIAISHIAKPCIANDDANNKVPVGTVAMATALRPILSASRPPTTKPTVAGMVVMVMNMEMSTAEYPRTSLR